MKLIDGWKKSYKLYSVQLSFVILVWSIVDGLLRIQGEDILPVWFYTVSAIGLILVRNIAQFFDTGD